MGALIPALLGMLTTATARVIAALGMCLLTVAGVDASIQTVKGMFFNSINQAPPAMAQLAGLAGCWDALGMLFGAVTFSVSYWAITKQVQIAAKG